MPSRRSGRVWTELHTNELFELVESTKRKLGALSAQAPIGSPIYDGIGSAQTELAKLLEMVSRPGANPWGNPVAHHDPEVGKKRPK